MTLTKLTTFAGLPVADFEQARMVADPAAFAWRISADDEFYEDRDVVSPAFAASFEEFVESPVAAFATAVVIGPWGASSRHTPCDLIAAAAPKLPALRALFYGDIVSEENEISWIRQDNMTPILDAYPALEIFRVRGSDGLGLPELRHDALRELAIESGGLPARVVDQVSRAHLPRLRHLELWLGTDEYGGDADSDDLATILAGTRFPELDYLGLRDSEIIDNLCGDLAGAPVLAQLAVLDLSLGMLTDDGAAALLSGQPLTHLRCLDLHHHFLSTEMQARIREELPGVDVDLSDGMDPEDEDRYIAVSE